MWEKPQSHSIPCMQYRCILDSKTFLSLRRRNLNGCLQICMRQVKQHHPTCITFFWYIPIGKLTPTFHSKRWRRRWSVCCWWCRFVYWCAGPRCRYPWILRRVGGGMYLFHACKQMLAGVTLASLNNAKMSHENHVSTCFKSSYNYREGLGFVHMAIEILLQARCVAGYTYIRPHVYQDPAVSFNIIQ